MRVVVGFRWRLVFGVDVVWCWKFDVCCFVDVVFLDMLVIVEYEEVLKVVRLYLNFL